MKGIKIGCYSLIAFFIASCASIGPRLISLDRGRYNDILNETENAQLLKNIVNLRYLEPMSYLKITNIMAAYSINSTVDASFNLPNKSTTFDPSNGLSTSWSFLQPYLDSNINYSDNPTISYVPYEAGDVVNELQKPMSFQEVMLLTHGGIHNVPLFLRLLFERLGTSDNGNWMLASSPGIFGVPRSFEKEMMEYVRLVNVIAKNINLLKISLRLVTYKNDVGALMHFNDNNSADALYIKKMLHMQGQRDIVFLDVGIRKALVQKGNRLVPETIVPEANVVPVSFRSLEGILSFLSYSVDVPKSDLALVRTTTDIDGKIINWNPIMNKIMRIYSSDKYPRDAFVKTKYNKHWFYIKSTDHDSKITFTLVVKLWGLIAARASLKEQTKPVFTYTIGNNATPQR